MLANANETLSFTSGLSLLSRFINGAMPSANNKSGYALNFCENHKNHP